MSNEDIIIYVFIYIYNLSRILCMEGNKNNIFSKKEFSLCRNRTRNVLIERIDSNHYGIANRETAAEILYI